MKTVLKQTSSVLLVSVIASACAAVGPEGRIEGSALPFAASNARAAMMPAPAALGEVQDPAPQDPVAEEPVPQDPVAEPPAAEPSPAAEDGWSFVVKPYFFAYGMKGAVGTGGRSTDIDAEFDDLFDALNIGGMLVFEAGLPGSEWTVLTDLMYVQIEDDGLTRGPGGMAVNAQIEQFVGELSVAYEVVDDGLLEVLGGARYWNTSSELEASLPSGPQRAEGSEDWVDPLVGARSRVAIGRDFGLLLRGDVGGFGVGSDFTFNLAAEFGWSISDTFQLSVGYRYLDVDYSDGATYDMTQAGPMLGLAITF